MKKSRVPGTVIIHGSQGEVMAPLGQPGTFYRGKHVKVLINQVCQDKDVPFAVREGLVGIKVRTIFTIEQIFEQTGQDFSLPKEARLAYAPAVIEALEAAGKNTEARLLEKTAPDRLDMYVLRPGTFALC